jgi:hypothetical protein
MTGLTEFSQSEYEIIGRQFKNGRNLQTPTVDFLGYSWNLDLGTVSSKNL